MRRADRLFRLVQRLRTLRFATADQLARELGVSARTIYRDVQDLVYAGVPIRGEAGVGYRLDNDYELPALTFTSEEIEGLVLGMRIVQSWGDAELGSAAASAMSKIESVLPGPLKEVLLGTPLFAPDFHRSGEGAPHVAQLRRAIHERAKLHFDYRREDGERSERSVRPLGLYFWGKKWTLAAWCELREDFRSFRPDRMESIEMLPERFSIDGDINLAAFVERVQEDDRDW